MAKGLILSSRFFIKMFLIIKIILIQLLEVHQLLLQLQIRPHWMVLCSIQIISQQFHLFMLIIGGRIIIIEKHSNSYLSNKIDINIMKYVTYFLSFFAYVGIHILRMGYSSVKPSFETTFELNNIFLGLFDGLVYISLALGFFLRYLIQGSTSKTKIYLIFGILTSIGYATIPILGLLLKNDQGTIGDQSPFVQYGVPGIALIVFGFCQFTAWPVLLYFVSQYFNEGTMLGIWSANGDFGNICGFFLGRIILTDLNMDWQYVMIIGAAFHLFMSILVFFILKNKKVSTDQLESQQLLAPKQKVSRKQKFLQFLSFSRQIIRVHENKMYLVSFGLLKAILYGFLLWMPTYLSHRNYKNEATFAPIIFNVCTIFGSGVLGFFYRENKRINRSEYQQMSCFKRFLHKLNKNLKGYSLFYSCVIITICITIFYTRPFDIVQTLVLNGITGFFLGGAFNMLASNEVVAITRGELEKVQMLSTLSMVCGNFFVGIVEIVIGIALNVKTDYTKQSNLFIVLLTISSLAAVIIMVRSTMIYRLRRKQSILLQNEKYYNQDDY